MRIVFFKVLNYAGIFNGMGLHELAIDFSKCRNTITLISGKNGVGKSTLLKALNPLPDGSENLMDKLPAEKIMDIIDDSGVLYHLYIQYPVTSNGTRSGTKAFISKNGVELNPTGNVTSYKEALFGEFELDNNYISLSKLSGDDRGLADKTPSERKKFVASILSSIDIYAEMYKTLSKKSNVYKSYINNLTTKIRNIGDEDSLQSKLVTIEAQQLRLNKEKEKLTKQKSEEEAFIKITDPDGKIQEKYSGLYESIKAINKDIEESKSKIDLNLKRLKDHIKSDNYDEELKRITNIYNDTDKSIAASEAKLTGIISNIESLNNSIDIDSGKLLNLKNGFEINNLRESVKVLRNTVETAQNILSSSQIAYETISRAEFETICTTLFNIRNNIKVIYDKYYSNEIVDACSLLLEGTSGDIGEIIEKYQEELNNQMSIQQSLEVALIQVESKLEDTEVLKNRPSKCKINDCPFIIKALEYSKQDLPKQADALNKDIISVKKNISDIKAKIKTLKSSALAISDIESIASQVNNTRLILDKIPESVIFTDNIELFNRIARLDLFIEVDRISGYVDIINASESYKIDSVKLKELEAELKVAESVEESIRLLEENIENKKKEIEEQKHLQDVTKAEIKFNKSLLDVYSNVIYSLEQVISESNNLSKLQADKQSLVDEYHTIDDSIKKIKEYIDHINRIDSDLNNIEHDLEPLQNDKENTNFALTSVQSYKLELAEYSNKFNTINTLRKYASPTTGIQTIYMDMYMGKTLSMANQLLTMLFGGEYSLLPYVINENEFRIPFRGSGLTIDDISSGSTSQICMIGMIMNLVLLFQASTKYNIVFLDEIDGGLDFTNRGLFINTLYQLINILNINQLIMISHNVESDLSNVDLIKLKGYENDSNDYRNANIIYDYDRM